jgi:hypothetical protein
MTNKQRYPVDDGWLHMELQLASAAMQSPDSIKSFIAKDPENYEFPVLEQHGKKIRAVFRRKPETPAAA